MAEPGFFRNTDAFRAWLRANAATAVELLVGYYKVSTGRSSMTWSESVDEALCYGWIDGIRRRIDEHSYSIRFTPRKPTSSWSAVNIAKVERLREQGRMTAAGEKAFAKRSAANSVVYSYEQNDAAALSPDELLFFNRNKTAWKYFEAAPPFYKKAVLRWITSAKRRETRASRVAKFIGACAAGERLR